MVEAQDEAWPFQEPVSAEEVPDYYTLVKVRLFANLKSDA